MVIERRSVVAKGWGGSGGGLTAKGHEETFLILEMWVSKSLSSQILVGLGTLALFNMEQMEGIVLHTRGSNQENVLKVSLLNRILYFLFLLEVNTILSFPIINGLFI